MIVKQLADYESMLGMIPLIQQLNPKMTPARYAELLEAMVRQGNYFQVACFDGGACLGLVGVWIGTQLWCGKFIEIDNFIVEETHRNRGVGTRLLHWVEQKGLEEGCQIMRLDTYVTLDQAQRFYFARGFKIEGFHMTKPLRAP